MQAIKTRDPGIKGLVRKFNAQRQEMKKIIARQRDGTRRVLPDEIDLEGLYKLDVDDSIWQEAGLDGASVFDAVPAWMGNERTRKGIQAQLALDRCLEEARLLHEIGCLQQWTLEEWASITRACANTGMLFKFSNTYY